VYNALPPFNFMHRITVLKMTNPSDLLVFNDCLYIPDDMNPRKSHLFGISDPHRIWKVPIPDSAGDVRPRKMLTSLGKWWPWSLSRMTDGKRILITTTTLKAYFWNPEEDRHETVTLPSDLHSAQHIIQLSDHSYLICHSSQDSSHLQKVCRLVLEGSAMSFLENPSCKDDLYQPEHLAELPDGKILVVDYYNNRVLVTAKDLKSYEVLLISGRNGNGKKRPCRIAYITRPSWVVVAFHHSVGVYSLNTDRMGEEDDCNLQSICSQ